MQESSSRTHLIYALFSFLIPPVAVLLTVAYQSVAHAEDWKTYGDELAGAYLALAEIIQIVWVIAISAAIGIVFALRGLRVWRQLISAGTTILLFNLVLFFLASYLLIRGMTRGW